MRYCSPPIIHNLYFFPWMDTADVWSMKNKRLYPQNLNYIFSEWFNKIYILLNHRVINFIICLDIQSYLYPEKE